MSRNDLDTVHLALDAINEGRKDPLRMGRRFEVGARGAYAVEGRAGDLAVLKCWPNCTEQRLAQRTRLPRVDRLRDLGWPIPELRQSGSTADVVFELWGMAPGEPGVQSVAPGPVIDQAVALVEAARGEAIGDGDDWPTWLTGSIRRSIERAEPNAGPDAQRLLELCRSAVDACVVAPGRDLIHGDFGPANCLIARDRIVAVVDFDDCRDGDGTLDLAGLAWDLQGWDKANRGVLDRLWKQVGDAAGPVEQARVLVAFWVAGSLAWAAGTSDEAQVVAVSRRVLNRF